MIVTCDRPAPRSHSALDRDLVYRHAGSPMKRSTAIVVAIGLAVAAHTWPTPALAGPIQYWGNNAELSIGAITDRTVEIVVVPLDDKGVPKSGEPSTAIVGQKPVLKLRTRDLTGPQEVVAGKLR